MQKKKPLTNEKLDKLKSDILAIDKEELPLKWAHELVALKVLENITGKTLDELQKLDELQRPVLTKDEVKIQNFFETIAQENFDKENLREAYTELDEISDDNNLREKAMVVAQRILSTDGYGIDNEEHFNYIPNRQKSLSHLVFLDNAKLYFLSTPTLMPMFDRIRQPSNNLSEYFINQYQDVYKSVYENTISPLNLEEIHEKTIRQMQARLNLKISMQHSTILKNYALPFELIKDYKKAYIDIKLKNRDLTINEALFF